MTSPDDATLPYFYKGYVDRVRNLDLIDALQLSQKELKKFIDGIEEAKGELRYAADKWSVKELICHVIDSERIFNYRALRFARGDKTPVAGFEEKDYAPEANASARTVAQLNAELGRLEDSTLDLFHSFTPAMLMRTGVANNVEISVVNIGYIIAGHRLHHLSILKDRYLSK